MTLIMNFRIEKRPYVVLVVILLIGLYIIYYYIIYYILYYTLSKGKLNYTMIFAVVNILFFISVELIHSLSTSCYTLSIMFFHRLAFL